MILPFLGRSRPIFGGELLVLEGVKVSVVFLFLLGGGSSILIHGIPMKVRKYKHNRNVGNPFPVQPTFLGIYISFFSW